MTAPERMRLVLPGVGEYVRVARVAAAVLARHHGFTVREVDELQRALGAALRDLLEGAPRGARIELAYAATDDEIWIDTVLLTPEGTARERHEELRRRRSAQPV